MSSIKTLSKTATIVPVSALMAVETDPAVSALIVSARLAATGSLMFVQLALSIQMESLVFVINFITTRKEFALDVTRIVSLVLIQLFYVRVVVMGWF